MVIALQVAAITLSTAVLWAVDSMAQPRFPDADIPPSSRRTYQQSFCHVVILVYVVIYYIFLLNMDFCSRSLRLVRSLERKLLPSPFICRDWSTDGCGCCILRIGGVRLQT